MTMRLKIEIVAEDAMGKFEELKNRCKLLFKDNPKAFEDFMGEKLKTQSLDAGLTTISVKVTVVKEGEGAK